MIQNNIDINNFNVSEIAEFLEANTLNKILKKLTDFAEILSEGKLSGIINYNFNFNREQTIIIKELLIGIGAISKVYVLAMKGSQDLEEEFISNIFSEYPVSNNLPAFLTLRNLLENRLNHQMQQYNMNMSKSNNTLAMPINELRGHTKTYEDLSNDNLGVSAKAQHGIIAASLHDAYVTLINKSDWWNDKTYMKYFLNGDDPSKPRNLILSREPQISLDKIHQTIKDILYKIEEIKSSTTSINEIIDKTAAKHVVAEKPGKLNSNKEKMMKTPFGNRYGKLIDEIISEIYLSEEYENISNEVLKNDILIIFEQYKNNSENFTDKYSTSIVRIVDYLITSRHTTKTFVENFLIESKKDSFFKFYSNENKETIDGFITELFNYFFELKFKRLFKIVKSIDLKKYACAFIIKRIYMLYGENINHFGYYLIKTIAKSGGLRK